MENTEQKKAAKPQSKRSNSSTLRVSNETRKKVFSELQKANKKTFGRKIKADHLIALAITRITAQDITELQEKSLSNQDRMEQAYREFVSKHGQISRDEFIGKLLTQNAANPTSENAAIPQEKMQK